MGNIIKEDVHEYINGINQAQNSDLADFRLRDEGTIPIILRDTETFLVTMIAMNKPRTLLEFGTATGFSASVMAMADENLEIDTFETDEERYLTAIANTNALQLSDRIHLHLADPILELDDIVGNKLYDMVFIDAAKSHYQEFWDAAIKHVHEASVIICDNVLLKGSIANKNLDESGRHITNIKKMRRFLDYITSAKGLTTTVVAIGDGTSISVIGKDFLK